MHSSPTDLHRDCNWCFVPFSDCLGRSFCVLGYIAWFPLSLVKETSHNVRSAKNLESLYQMCDGLL